MDMIVFEGFEVANVDPKDTTRESVCSFCITPRIKLLLFIHVKHFEGKT